MIGPDASSIQVKELATDGRYFWAATNLGVFRAEKNNPNLQDYKNWNLQVQLPNNQFTSIVQFNNRIYTCNVAGNCYAFDGLNWQIVFPEIRNILKIKASSSALAFITNKSIEVTGTTTPLFGYKLRQPDSGNFENRPCRLYRWQFGRVLDRGSYLWTYSAEQSGAISFGCSDKSGQ